MSTYYVVKKRDPGEVFGVIVVVLVIIAMIVMLAVYVGAIALAIIGGIAAVVGTVYSIVLYIICTTKNIKIFAQKPKNVKELFVTWHRLTIQNTKDAVKLNATHAGNIANRSKIYRKTNPVKYLALFLAFFLIVLGVIFIFSIAILQYALMIFLIFGLVWVFVAMIFISMFVSFFISFVIGIKYLVNAEKYYHMYGSFKLSTYAHFNEFGNDIKLYWSEYKNILKGFSNDMISLAKGQWSNVKGYVYYSPLKYYYCASPITLVFNVGVVAILFSIFSCLSFIVLLFIKLICCVISLIMRH